MALVVRLHLGRAGRDRAGHRSRGAKSAPGTDRGAPRAAQPEVATRVADAAVSQIYVRLDTQDAMMCYCIFTTENRANIIEKKEA